MDSDGIGLALIHDALQHPDAVTPTVTLSAVGLLTVSRRLSGTAEYVSVKRNEINIHLRTISGLLKFRILEDCVMINDHRCRNIREITERLAFPKTAN